MVCETDAAHARVDLNVRALRPRHRHGCLGDLALSEALVRRVGAAVGGNSCCGTGCVGMAETRHVGVLVERVCCCSSRGAAYHHLARACGRRRLTPQLNEQLDARTARLWAPPRAHVGDRLSVREQIGQRGEDKRGGGEADALERQQARRNAAGADERALAVNIAKDAAPAAVEGAEDNLLAARRVVRRAEDEPRQHRLHAAARQEELLLRGVSVDDVGEQIEALKAQRVVVRLRQQLNSDGDGARLGHRHLGICNGKAGE